MPSIKQIKNRLLLKKNSLDKVNSNITRAGSSKNSVTLRKLNQEKGALGQDIRNLERQLITMENAARDLKIAAYKIDRE